MHRNLALTKGKSQHLLLERYGSSLSGFPDMGGLSLHKASSIITMEGIFERLEKVEQEHMHNFETS